MPHLMSGNSSRGMSVSVARGRLWMRPFPFCPVWENAAWKEDFFEEENLTEEDQKDRSLLWKVLKVAVSQVHRAVVYQHQTLHCACE